jgi:hypothetical protein
MASACVPLKSSDFKEGLSLKVEPWQNAKWDMAAFRLPFGSQS